jgi:hypothetical protein
MGDHGGPPKSSVGQSAPRRTMSLVVLPYRLRIGIGIVIIVLLIIFGGLAVGVFN